MTEREQKVHAICCSNDLPWTYKSSGTLLILSYLSFPRKGKLRFSKCAISSLAHSTCENLPVLSQYLNGRMESSQITMIKTEDETLDSEATDTACKPESHSEPHFIKKKKLNALVRYLRLHWQNAQVSVVRKRSEILSSYFSTEN